ncbi:MAG TPA: STAS domain-containing protein [Pyrinomonadaceae bacterium]|nr:STAS domain-containing protein [Pyrinomonadaceae bacterium]
MRDIVILDLAGTISSREGGAVLRNAISRKVRNGDKKILLNLAKVSSIDASEAEQMVSTLGSVHKDGSQLKLCSPSSKVQAQLEQAWRSESTSTVGGVLISSITFKSEQEALASFE